MTTKRRILLLAANPRDTGRIGFDEEFRRIEDAISGSKARDVFEIRTRGALQPGDLLHLHNDYKPHIVHICGHGREGEGFLFSGPDGAALAAPAEALADAFRVVVDNISLVVLSACYMEEQARAIARHIEWVAGIHSFASDEDAIAFAGAFYGALGHGRSVDNAFEQGDVLLALHRRREAFVLFRNSVQVPTTRESSVSTNTREEQLVHIAPTAHEFELTVHLDRHADRLEARYQHGAGAASPPIAIPWAEHGPALERAARTLDSGDRSAIRDLVAGAATANGIGPHLFAALFRDEAGARRVLLALSQDPQRSTPIALPVHVRVCTRDPLLAGLPWRLTAWQHRLLAASGWQFATTHAARPAGDFTMTVPCHVVVLAPDAPDDRHVSDIKDAFAGVWKHDREQRYLRVVATAAGLENALRGAKPDILYIHARADANGGRPALVVRTPRTDDAARTDTTADTLPLDELPALFARAGHTPRAVYINATGTALPCPPLAGPPLVIWRRTPPAETELPRLWLESWLGHGRDPVDALHRAANHLARAAGKAAGSTPDNGAGAIDAATACVHAEYRTWSTPRYVRRAPKDDPLALLDRDSPKAYIDRHIYDLAHSPTLRVLAIVGYAESGNRIAELWSQLRTTLDERGKADAEIRWIQLTFPEQRHQLAVDLEAELCEQLGREPGETTGQLLSRYAPNAQGAQRPIVWLNWGVFGSDARHQAPLKASQLAAWLRFSSEYLTAHCPPGLRVVSYLAIETDKPEKVAELVNNQYKHPWIRDRSFQLDQLHADIVHEKDLLKYLRDYSSCPAAIQSELSWRIMTATAGGFDATVTLLKSTRGDRWHKLLNKLRADQGDPDGTIDDDETF